MATITVVLIPLLSGAISNSQEERDKAWARYYPLERGNLWKYSVTGEKDETRRKYVVWKVINSSSDSVGKIFSVWPTPADSDDVGMQLQVTNEGLRETSSDFFLLRFPLQKGNTWTVPRHNRVFTVLVEGERCAVGNLRFDACTMIQDDDQEAKLRTITTYALGVGPVRYEYYKSNGEQFGTHASQTLSLVSYSVDSLRPSTKHEK